MTKTQPLTLNPAESPSRIHFIAIGGAAMHNLALELHHKGHSISGSDDQIHEPSRSRLLIEGLLPEKEGWFPSRITDDLDAVILGMHARPNNPELQKAQNLGLKIYSFPEFLHEQTRSKKRFVIGGSHGKTTITSIVLHVLRLNEIDCDYLVGSLIDGFDTMVGINDRSRIAVFEGDEYLTSPLDHRPKFLHYHPHVALISGIAWDHANVFPSAEIYKKQFERFLESIEEDGTVIYCEEDAEVVNLVESSVRRIERIPYQTHPYEIRDRAYHLKWNKNLVQLGIFGQHNMQNISAAKEICKKAGVSDAEFYAAIPSFQGAAKRLECLYSDSKRTVFLDFAHAPSKVRATTAAVRQLFPDRILIACLELHTFSSLSAEFIPHYHGTLDPATIPIVFFDPETLARKGLPPLDKQQVIDSFGRKELQVFTAQSDLERFLRKSGCENTVLLLMSSGNFGGLDLKKLVRELT